VAHRQPQQRRGGGLQRLRAERRAHRGGVARALGARLRLAHHALHGLRQPLAADGLEHVVECRQLERLDGVLVVRGHEHHDGRVVALQVARHLEPGEVGHVDVEERGVGLGLRDQRQRLTATLGHAGHLHVLVLGQQPLQVLARTRLVVGDHHS
jgi:hypothetical protein